MRVWRFLQVPSVDFTILRCASWLVPSQQRVEWSAEWRAELWHVLHGDDQSLRRTTEPSMWDATAFCLGAFQDAFWLRRHSPPSEVQPWLPWKKARQCVIFLAALASANLIIALLLPGVRSALRQSPYQDANSLVLISRRGYLHAVFQQSRSRNIGLGNFASKPSSPTLRSISRPTVWRESDQHPDYGIIRCRGERQSLRSAEDPAPIDRDRGSQTNSSTHSGTEPGGMASLFQRRHACCRQGPGSRRSAGGYCCGSFPMMHGSFPGQMDAWLLEDDRGLAALLFLSPWDLCLDI